MITVTLTQKEACQLWLTLGVLAQVENKGSSYIANGKHPAHKRGVFISEVGIQTLQGIRAKLTDSGPL